MIENLVEPMAEKLDPLLEVLATRTGKQTLLVGVGGSVGVGKTVFASQLVERLNALAPTFAPAAQIVSTDGFLLPNSVLEPRGLIERKGFPESYDRDGLTTFVERVRSGSWPINVPRYSHETFDVGAGASLDRSAVMVLEGINALQEPLGPRLDVAIYLHADEPIVRRWFIDRMLRLIATATEHPGGFYDRFVEWPLDRQAAFAEQVWEGVNLPNLREHIAPSRNNAHWVVEFDAHHNVVEVVGVNGLGPAARNRS